MSSNKPGRPSTYGTPSSARLYVRVTPAVRLELRRVAAERGTNVAGVIRELIDERVEERRPFPGEDDDDAEGPE